MAGRGHGRGSADSVEKLASKISRLLTPKSLPVTVRFGEPASSNLRQTELSWSSSSRLFSLLAEPLSFLTESANSGTLNSCRERPLVVEIPGLDRARDCNRLALVPSAHFEPASTFSQWFRRQKAVPHPGFGFKPARCCRIVSKLLAQAPDDDSQVMRILDVTGSPDFTQ